MDIRVFGGMGKTLGGSPVAGNTTSTVNKPPGPVPDLSKGSQQSPRYSKDTGNLSSPEATVSHLPGGKTPDKKFVPKNKPVSQGGNASFGGGAVNKTVDFDWSDSEDDEILLNLSKEMEEKGIIKTKPVIDFSDDSDIEFFDDSTIEKKNAHNQCNDTHNITGVNERVGSSSVSESTSEASGSNVAKCADHTETSDVRSMLRKVWGEKFNNKTKQVVKNVVTTKNGSAGSVKRLSGDQCDMATNKKPKLSDTNFPNEIERPSRREVISNSVDQRGLSGVSGRIGAKNPFQSPIHKFFKDCNTSLLAQSGSKTETLKNQSATVFKEFNTSSSAQSGSNTETLKNQSANTSGNCLSNNEDNTGLSCCPVCNKGIETAKINDHLDECLTLHSLSS